ncbi:MAG: family transposase [Proteobacteria bacterium]|nr:family transposase [Pseudomonadota bacterium]
MHAPKVECISKGKARQPYEFGVKVTVATTHKEGLPVRVLRITSSGALATVELCRSEGEGAEGERPEVAVFSDTLRQLGVREGDRYVESMTCAELFRVMVFASTGHGCHFLVVYLLECSICLAAGVRVCCRFYGECVKICAR